MSHNTPSVTVGIIARNEEKNIINTLEHIVKQDYPHDKIEIIIVDGNSTDKTREMAEEFLKKQNIRYSIYNEAREPADKDGCSFGHSFARNIVLRYMSTSTDYIGWIDADCRADPSWLSTLVNTMETTIDNNVVGAGGRRIVEEIGENISKKELMLNYYFTSKIMSLGNPAFAESDVIYMSSIAGYNSIYSAAVLKKYGYNTTYPFNTDDIEINYRLTRDGYRFLHAKDAKIYHRMDANIGLFFRQMINYGKGAMNSSKIHKRIIRLYIPLGIGYFCYIITLPILMGLSKVYIGNMLYPLIPFIFVIILSIAVFVENWNRTKSIWSTHVLYITAVHPLLYGYGALLAFFSKK